MTWLILMHGVPKEPKTSDWDELTTLPTPHDFFETLFMRVCGIDVRKTTRTEVKEIPPFEQWVYGFQGTEEIGLRWVEKKDRESSLMPLYVEQKTYGLPGMTIYWAFSWHYAGQAGHAAFRHRSLLAQFDPVEAFEHFRAVWREVFRVAPLFQPAPKSPPAIDEKIQDVP